MKIKSYQLWLGMEIHLELKTVSKMFCACPADHFGKKPNTQVCPTCLGLPGALPVANRQAIEATVLAGLALGCQVPLFSKFDRKNYFYPDLPKGYQISQYDLPLAIKGRLNQVGIRRVHLEEDTAKMIHDRSVSLLDFNRSGVPLMEVVTEPEIHSSTQAKEWLQELQQLLRYLGVTDADMEKGSMRLEANISLSSTDHLPDYKVEIKNLNSFRFVQKAIDYEQQRQTELLSQGKKPLQETRGWDEKKQISVSQRSKEEAQDYRYFPEPDLPPIRWTKMEIEQIKVQLPELPAAKKRRWIKQYSLPESTATVLLRFLPQAEYFEKAAFLGKKQGLEAKDLANLMVNRRLDWQKLTPAQLIGRLVKEKSQAQLPLKQGEEIVVRVIEANPRAVADYRQGKAAVIEFLLGQVMAQTRGKADPNLTRKQIQKKLKEKDG